MFPASRREIVGDRLLAGGLLLRLFAELLGQELLDQPFAHGTT